jgi:SAM domain (Sterile alpha motif)
MDIATWLRGLGLAQYEPIFRENAIDAEILPELTEADLEKLGVVLGHRKRILRDRRARHPPSSATASRFSPRRGSRTAPTDRDVLRPGRLDAAVGAL